MSDKPTHERLRKMAKGMRQGGPMTSFEAAKEFADTLDAIALEVEKTIFSARHAALSEGVRATELQARVAALAPRVGNF